MSDTETDLETRVGVLLGAENVETVLTKGADWTSILEDVRLNDTIFVVRHVEEGDPEAVLMSWDRFRALQAKTH